MTEHYDIEFHFPYASVKVEKLERDEADMYALWAQRANHFEVNTGKSTYIINPALLTYVHIKPYSPF